jgi:hypothetical protein
MDKASSFFRFVGVRSPGPKSSPEKSTADQPTTAAPETTNIPDHKEFAFQNSVASSPSDFASLDNTSSFLHPTPSKSAAPQTVRGASIRGHMRRRRERDAAAAREPAATREARHVSSSPTSLPPPPKSQRVGDNESADESTTSLREAHRNANAKSEEPETSPSHGKKRRMVGKTFKVPDYDDSASEGDTSPVKPVEDRPKLKPFLGKSAESADDSSRVLGQKQNAQSPFDTAEANATERALGRTYKVPDYSSSDLSSIMSLDPTPQPAGQSQSKGKSMSEWTLEDAKQYMKLEHGWDPESLAAEVSLMQRGEMPSIFIKAQEGIALMKSQAAADLREYMDGFRRREFARVRAEVTAYRHSLIDEIEERRMELAAINQEIGKKHAQLIAEKSADEMAAEVADQTPPMPSGFNMFAASNGHDWNKAPPASPSPSHAQLPQTPKASVTWTEQHKTNHTTSPGPNEPPKYAGAANTTTPAPKSALKTNGTAKANGVPPPNAQPQIEEGRSSTLTGPQRQSYERKMSEVNKYTPKQPSRLREVSRLSSSSLLGLDSPTPHAAALDPLSPLPVNNSLSDVTMASFSDTNFVPDMQSAKDVESFIGNPATSFASTPSLFEGLVETISMSPERIAAIAAANILPPSGNPFADLVEDAFADSTASEREFRLNNIAAAFNL